MKIGNVQIAGEVLLAPLAAYTSWPFRRICRRLGAALVTTEVVKARELVRGIPSTRQIIEFQPDEHPIVGQILSGDPAEAADAAVILAELGFDIVDLNCGCPKRRVISDNMGGALAASPEIVERIVERMSRAVRIPVTIKIRAGFEAGRITAVETARRCENAGAKAVCVHPRYAQKAASRPPDWNVIAHVKQAVSIPVIGNGGIRSPADALRMFSETGCDAVAIGQGAIGRPWIFHHTAILKQTGIESPAPSQQEILDILLEHYRGLAAHHGEKQGTIIMRKQSCHYAKHLHNGKAFNEAVSHASTTAEFMAAVEYWLMPHQGIQP